MYGKVLFPCWPPFPWSSEPWKPGPPDRAPVTISIPTAATTSTASYPIGAALGNLWSTRLPYVKASVQSSKGGVQNLQPAQHEGCPGLLRHHSITYQP